MSNKVICLDTVRKENLSKEKMLDFIDQQITADANSVQPLPRSLLSDIDALILAAEQAKAAAEILEG
jgi:hypothetical protein